MNNFGCVLFDLDGTLIDTSQLIIDSFQYTIKKHLDINVPEAEIILSFGRRLVDTLSDYSPEKTDDMLETYREYNESRHDSTTKLIPGVKETLIELKSAGFTLGVVTGKRRRLALRGLRLFGLDSYMETVVTPEDTTEHKPHPAPVLKALDLLGEDPNRTIMVGDSTLDLACARSAGTYTAAVSWSFAPLELLQAEKPDFILKRMGDLIDICLS